jgi:hypothetical protein
VLPQERTEGGDVLEDREEVSFVAAVVAGDCLGNCVDDGPAALVLVPISGPRPARASTRASRAPPRRRRPHRA